jgi:hypothetical protein
VALYSRSTLSKAQAIQLLHLYRTRHHLTDAAFEDLLALLNSYILPENNTLPRFRNMFTNTINNQPKNTIFIRQIFG